MQKGKARKAHKLPERLPCGEIIVQTHPVKKKWQLGEVIGQGGFGLIYTAFDVTDGASTSSSDCVIKIEPLDNGPLFCEFHFYQRVAKPDLITQWIQKKHLQYLGVPQFLGSGQHERGKHQYRFLVLQRLSFDLQKVFVQSGRSFPESTVLPIALRMLDALEYIHDNGYCHADIKAANILLGFSNGKTDFNQVYLVDYGLASSYLVDKGHKPYREDPKRAHDGTTEYASRDAHNGACASRRGDLEILGYCMLEWLTGQLPWHDKLSDKDRVRNLKTRYMKDIPGLLKACFGKKPCPEGVRRYLEMVAHLTYTAKPNYHQLRQVLSSGLDDEWTLGLQDDSSQARGVKRGKEKAGLSSPQQRKVHLGFCSASSQPAVIQTPARNCPPSSKKPSSAGNLRNTPANPGKTPLIAVRNPGSAVSLSGQGKKPFPVKKGPMKHSVVVRGARPMKVLAKDSSPSQSNRLRTSARKNRGFYCEVDGGSSQDSDEEYSPEQNVYSHERVPYQGVDRAYQPGDTYDYEPDGEYYHGSERDTDDGTEDDMHQETVDSHPDEEEEPRSGWRCYIL